jgi:hypothetical protein
VEQERLVGVTGKEVVGAMADPMHQLALLLG